MCPLTKSLIVEVSGNSDLSSIEALDLHIRDSSKGKIRKIENLTALLRLKQLNLSYNAISKVEGLDRLVNLVELNLAENCITKVN
jgi:centriolin